MKERIFWLGLAVAFLIAAWLLNSHVPWAINLLLPAAGWFALKGLT
ncbi:MAG: hypothetical protein HYX42_00820 [Polaromonas sp.]|nr:hypothetical protein [Polaromonas sp.]MBI2724768.1 hypothetical protein [Polaromonas sp.]